MIIVTGGAGFIGSNILAGLEQDGFTDLVSVDWLGRGDKWRNIAKRELFAILTPDQLDDFLAAHRGRIDAIIHMGAISTTTETDVDLIVRQNVQLTWRLWEYCRDNDVRFIYASSAATYGGGEHGFDDRDDLKYLNALRPLNPYGWSKAFIDRRIARELQCRRCTPPQHVGLKFFNVYGPNEYHKGGQKSVIAHIFPDVVAGRAVKLFKSYNPKYADGWQLRDFVWVGDIVNVIKWFLHNPCVSGLFNVGSGRARSFYDLARATADAAGRPLNIEFTDMPESLRDKYQYYTCANINKLRAVGYDAPMTELEDGIAQYVRNYLMQDDIYA